MGVSGRENLCDFVCRVIDADWGEGHAAVVRTAGSLGGEQLGETRNGRLRPSTAHVSGDR